MTLETEEKRRKYQNWVDFLYEKYVENKGWGFKRKDFDQNLKDFFDFGIDEGMEIERKIRAGEFEEVLFKDEVQPLDKNLKISYNGVELPEGYIAL
jgi:hypothetical protein